MALTITEIVGKLGVGAGISVTQQGGAAYPPPRDVSVQSQQLPSQAQVAAMKLAAREMAQKMYKMPNAVFEPVMEPMTPMEPLDETEPMTPMEPLDETELQAGTALDIRKVATPKMGEQFDTNRMVVECVLVMNRLVEEVTALKEEIAFLRGEKQVAELADTPMPGLKLLSDSYKDVQK